MAKSNYTGLFKFFISASLILLFVLILPFHAAAQGNKADQSKGAIQSPAGKPDNAGETSDKTTYKTIRITMEMEAGAALYKAWPGGGKTMHAGIGWIEPFGRSEYVAGMDYPEIQKFPKPSYFNEEWMKVYSTKLFCIYMLKDGNIYAYDGVVGNLESADGDDGKMDYLMNVIVGGTGAYEGATGMLLGHTPGRGKNTGVADGVKLPVSILKLMEGYIKIPLKK
jgi:hypothetical protein